MRSKCIIEQGNRNIKVVGPPGKADIWAVNTTCISYLLPREMLVFIEKPFLLTPEGPDFNDGEPSSITYVDLAERDCSDEPF